MSEWIIEAETIGNISDGYWYSNGEEIVRCKDCIYNKPWEGTILSFCSYHDNAQYVRRAEDYCSRGERRDDE